MIKPKITIEDFEKIDLRVGKIIAVEHLPNAKYTTHKLTIDYGPEIGQKVSGARVVQYKDDELLGRLVVGVVNLPERQIGHLFSQSLTLGVPDNEGECAFLMIDKDVPLGGKVY